MVMLLNIVTCTVVLGTRPGQHIAVIVVPLQALSYTIFNFTIQPMWLRVVSDDAMSDGRCNDTGANCVSTILSDKCKKALGVQSS